MTQNRIDALRAELKALEEQEEKDKKTRRAAVKRVWRFVLVPSKSGSLHQIRDSAVVRYRLEGTVVNAEELKAVGNSEDFYRTGGMNYLFNTATGRIIMSEGGGNIYIPDGRWGDSAIDAEQTFAKLDAFLATNPDGGDVTEIIVSQPNFKWR